MARGKRRFLTQRGKPGYVYNYTDALAGHDDMYECDDKGRLLERLDEKPPQGNMGIKVPPIGATKEKPDGDENPPLSMSKGREPAKDMVDFTQKRSAMVAQANDIYGKKAAHIKANWKTSEIIEEIKKLAFNASIGG